MIKIYTDAAVNGNPGQAGIGIVISGQDIYEQLSHPLEGLWNNHLAEFEAIKYSLEWALENKLQENIIFIFSDSKTATDALQKGSSANQKYQDYLNEIYDLETNFQFINLEWIPEKNNLGADNLARQALQKAL